MYRRPYIYFWQGSYYCCTQSNSYVGRGKTIFEAYAQWLWREARDQVGGK